MISGKLLHRNRKAAGILVLPTICRPRAKTRLFIAQALY
jgi:hypothetical protein